MSAPVTLYRAKNRGAEGGGVPVAWDLVPDVASLDIAQDWIRADAEGLMWRIVGGGLDNLWPSVWTNVSGAAVSLPRLTWAPTSDCVSAWSLCDAPGRMMREAASLLPPRDAALAASQMTRKLFWGHSLDTPFVHVLDVADVLARGEGTVDTVDRAVKNAYEAAVQWGSCEFSSAWGAAREVGLYALAVELRRSTATRHLEHLGDCLGAARGKGPASDLVRRFVTPDMVFSALARRAAVSDGR